MIRKATIDDVKTIHRMINRKVNEGILLARSLSDIYSHVRDFYVYIDPESGKIAGACSLYILWEDTAEIRSLVVPEAMRRRGIGRKLVQACIDEARQMGFEKVFTLTYETEFFRNYGFRTMDKTEIPHKIWAACIHCPKFPDCDEVAMVKELGAA